MDELIQKAATETGCVYYGMSQAGDKLFVREAYVDGDAMNAHLENVGPCIEKILAGPASLDEISIHGPAEELEKVKPGTEALGATYFIQGSGFQNYLL